MGDCMTKNGGITRRRFRREASTCSPWSAGRYSTQTMIPSSLRSTSMVAGS